MVSVNYYSKKTLPNCEASHLDLLQCMLDLGADPGVSVSLCQVCAEGWSMPRLQVFGNYTGAYCSSKSCYDVVISGSSFIPASICELIKRPDEMQAKLEEDIARCG